MKKIVVDAFQSEEVRIAIVQNNRLENLEVLKITGSEKRGNIYKGVVCRIEKHLEAAFIDYGLPRHGFLPLNNLAQEYKSNKKSNKKISIADCLKIGQEIIVQVEKEERANKGAALTTIINLASTYIVLSPNDSKISGISKSIPQSSRNTIKKIYTDLKIPENMGVIIRTIGTNQDSKDLQWGLDYLCSLWKAIQKCANENKAPFLIYEESLVIKSMRDYLRNDIEQVVINNHKLYQEVLLYTEGVIPDFSERIKFYDEKMPIFDHYKIEIQTALAFSREISLISGGSVIFDYTEALVAVDVNSSKSNRGSNIEETALTTNLEAAVEIARQLKLRDIGGIIIIDFIDMRNEENRQKVVDTFIKNTKNDRSLIKVNGISSFGLLEVSRQRLRSSINDSNQMICPQCSGVGQVSTVEAMAVKMIRFLQKTLLEKQIEKIILYVPANVSSYLVNEKRYEIHHLETTFEASLIVVPNPNSQIPRFSAELIEKDDKKKNINRLSYKSLKEQSYSYDGIDKTDEKAKIDTTIDAPARKKNLFEKLGIVNKKNI